MQEREAKKFDNNIIEFYQPADFYYRLSQKLMDESEFISALSSIRQAVDMEPDNGEYLLCLAEILTELAKYEESNRVIFEIIENGDDLAGDCFFCLGCNFMGLDDVEKARESFDKYLAMYPEGDYQEEVEDFLFYFNSKNIQSFIDSYNSSEDFRMADEGKKHLDATNYEQAVEVLEKIPEDDVDMAYARNNLALAHYCLKDTEAAIEVTKGVLSQNPNNVHANCNMAVFMNEQGKKEEAENYISAAMAQKSASEEDLYKTAITLCELKMHESAARLLKKLLEHNPYEEKTLFYLAAALHNTGRLKEAMNLLYDIKKLDYPGVIAEYYIIMINREFKNPGKFMEMEYVYQVPAEEAKKKIRSPTDCIKLPDKEFMSMWKSDRQFMNTILWGLEYGDDNIKRALVGMVAGFADKRAEKLLRDFLLKREQPDNVKNDVFVLLKRMGAQEPYIAYVDGEVVEVKVGAYDKNQKNIGENYIELYNILRDVAREHYSENVMRSAVDVLGNCLESGEPDAFDEPAPELAAAILYIALARRGEAERLSALCGLTGADIDAALVILGKLEGNHRQD